MREKSRISGRGTRKLVDAGLDLAAAMREASQIVGGMGGGHDVASGATIPKGTAMKFIDMIDSIIEKQLKIKSMKIKGKLTFKSERAEELVNIIAQSLAPDNVPEMETIITG